MLNINAQPSVHVIHQRLQELKQNGVFGQTTPSSGSSSCDSKPEAHITMDLTQKEDVAENKEKDVEITSEKVVGGQEEKPQIDLNEFLQQLGVLKKERQVEESDTIGSFADPESSITESNEELGPFAGKNFNWDALIEMHAMEDHVAGVGTFQVYDVNEELSFPTSIWNF